MCASYQTPAAQDDKAAFYPDGCVYVAWCSTGEYTSEDSGAALTEGLGPVRRWLLTVRKWGRP